MNARMVITALLIATSASLLAQNSFGQGQNSSYASTNASDSYSSATTNNSSTTIPRKKKRIDLKKDFATLGDNGDLEERAKGLSSNQKVEVVQNRIVDRYNRFELGANFGMGANGDPYVRTMNLGAQLDYHFTPQWSLGGRYYHSYNSYTAEYDNITSRASTAQTNNGVSSPIQVPALDAPVDTEMAVVNFYPIYGKLNMFDSGVAHFDLYLLAGAGQVQLLSGNSTTYTGGMGVGVWISQHISLRGEIRYQGYQDLVGGATPQNRQENLIQGQLGIGFLL